MSIVIFGDIFSFPDGGPATNRVYTYVNGFIENGVKAYVVCFSNDYLDKKDGLINGIRYFQPFAQEKRSKYFIIRNWKKVLKFFNTYRIIKKINKEDKIIAINSCSNFLSTHLFGYLLSRFTNSKLIVECSEHPLRHYQSTPLKKRQGELFFRIESAISDGVFCISHFLIEFYKSRGVASNKLFLVPSTVDPSRFITTQKKPVDYKYVGYFGSLSFIRDNVDLLLKAFALFCKSHPEIYLILGGFCTAKERKDIEDMIVQLDIKNRVLLLGYLTRDEIIQYVANADILVMVRADDIQSKASYPSKLTEYLASSRPVISVNVGEISLYLKDEVDVFLVEPGNAKALAEKLDFVYSNPQIAYTVAKNGKRLTETIFNYKYQAERMIAFINSLHKNLNKIES